MSLIDQLGESWYNVLKDEFKQEYMHKLSYAVNYQRGATEVYPEPDDVFRAYKLTQYEDVKVVILGQDPYYNGSADGLAFSYKEGHRKARFQSLDVIWEELEKDVKFGLYLDFNYDLSWMAVQGVLLLNTILTVNKGKPLSHYNFGWQRFTGRTLAHLINRKKPLVFMLWGSEAKNFYKTIRSRMELDDSHHLVLEAVHPAYDIRNAKFGELKENYPHTFLGCGHFSKANAFLESNNQKKILW